MAQEHCWRHACGGGRCGSEAKFLWVTNKKPLCGVSYGVQLCLAMAPQLLLLLLGAELRALGLCSPA